MDATEIGAVVLRMLVVLGALSFGYYCYKKGKKKQGDKHVEGRN